MGANVSLADFYVGYGFMLIFALGTVSVLLWLLAANYQPTIVAVLAVFLMLMAITEFIYFFPLAAAFSGLGGICSGFTLLKRNEYKKL